MEKVSFSWIAPVLIFTCLIVLPSYVSAQTCYPGDASGDGKAMGVDYVIWLNHYNQTTTRGCIDGDFSGDNHVTGVDYVIWLNNYGSSTITPTPHGDPAVHVVSPNGGEIWGASAVMTITWDGITPTPATVNLWKGGSKVQTIITNYNSTSYDWKIPTNITAGADYRIEVVSQNTDVSDFSDNYFSIVVPSPLTSTPTPTSSVYSCGNGVCNLGESCSNCPGDCSGVCNLDHKVICGALKEGLDPSRFTTNFTNKWLLFPVGLVNELTDGSLTVRVSVLNQIEVVNGVNTRVVEEREWSGSNLVEVSRNYFTQSPDGNVCYFGEWVDEYSGGVITGHGGSWRSDQSNAYAGVMMPANPRVGMTWLIEDAAAYGAYEDGVVKSIGNTWNTRWGTIQNALHISEDSNTSQKRYAKCLGMIFDDGIDLSSTTQTGECP